MPSVELLAGQLRYLFEDEPDLRAAPPETVAERLNHDDRYARARAHYPQATDAEVHDHIEEFPARIDLDAVKAAIAMAQAHPG